MIKSEMNTLEGSKNGHQLHRPPQMTGLTRDEEKTNGNSADHVLTVTANYFACDRVPIASEIGHYTVSERATIFTPLLRYVSHE